MAPLDLVKLNGLMERGSGSPEVKIGLIDGPVAVHHPDLAGARLIDVSGGRRASCSRIDGAACRHGTFIAGALSAARGTAAPAICPSCTLLVHPIFSETTLERESMPSAKPQELAEAIIACIDAGAWVINLSVALSESFTRGDQAIEDALDQAVRRGVIVVAAAGNQGVLGSTAITRHPWVIPVAACDEVGRPLHQSNLGGSIGRRGLSAPGVGVTSLGSEGRPLTLSGTSVAAPFVTGAVALLWSEFPGATAAQIKRAVTQASTGKRASVVPPLLDAASADRILSAASGRSGSP